MIFAGLSVCMATIRVRSAGMWQRRLRKRNGEKRSEQQVA